MKTLCSKLSTGPQGACRLPFRNDREVARKLQQLTEYVCVRSGRQLLRRQYSNEVVIEAEVGSMTFDIGSTNSVIEKVIVFECYASGTLSIGIEKVSKE